MLKSIRELIPVFTTVPVAGRTETLGVRNARDARQHTELVLPARDGAVGGFRETDGRGLQRDGQSPSLGVDGEAQSSGGQTGRGEPSAQRVGYSLADVPIPKEATVSIEEMVIKRHLVWVGMRWDGLAEAG